MKVTKRRLRKVVLFVLLGAIVNIAMAWGCTAYVQYGEARRGGRTDGNPCWEFGIREGFGSCEVYSKRYFQRFSKQTQKKQPESVPKWSRIRSPAPTMNIKVMGSPVDYYLREDARGWPCLAMRCQWTWREIGNSTRYYRVIYETTDGILLDRNRTPSGAVALPLAPIWPGFAINTVFYAAIPWVLFAAPGKLRRWRRRKRGLCAACAYPIGSSDTCTECGAEL